MKSICLVHYCPWPADTGTKIEMMKHLNVLKDLGSCTIACTRVKPAGFGWTTEAEAALREQEEEDAVDEGKVVLVATLDLAGAFDTVDHGILVDKLARTCGVVGAANDLLKDYLNGRRQRVRKRDEKSQWQDSP